jgi:hypothetical protein
VTRGVFDVPVTWCLHLPSCFNILSLLFTSRHSETVSLCGLRHQRGRIDSNLRCSLSSALVDVEVLIHRTSQRSIYIIYINSNCLLASITDLLCEELSKALFEKDADNKFKSTYKTIGRDALTLQIVFIDSFVTNHTAICLSCYSKNSCVLYLVYDTVASSLPSSVVSEYH